MRDSPQRRYFEPVNTAMPETDSVYIQRLGHDDEVGAIAADVPALGEIRHACKAAAFFIHGPALLDGAVELHSAAPDGLDCIDRSGDAGFLIGGSSSIDLAVANEARKRIDGPPTSDRHNIEVPIEMQQRARRAES